MFGENNSSNLIVVNMGNDIATDLLESPDTTLRITTPPCLDNGGKGVVANFGF
jgi:hypothetical protein